MNAKEATLIALVIVGILTGVLGVLSLEAVIGSVLFPWEGGTITRLAGMALSLLPPLILLWGAGYMIRDREQLADRLFPEAGRTGAGGAAVPELCGLAVSVLGLFLAVTAIPSLVQWAGTALVETLLASSERSVITGELGSRAAMLPHMTVEAVAAATQLALGALLVALRSPIARLLYPSGEGPPVAPPVLLDCPTCGTPYDPTDYRQDLPVIRCSRCGAELPTNQPAEPG